MGKTNPSKIKTQAERLEEMSRIVDGIVQYIKQQEEEKQREQLAALHNTRLLLRNYHKLINHYEQAICRESDLRAETFDIELIVDQFSTKEVVIESIRLSRKRTIIMMEHMKTCLRLLEMDYSSQPEKYQAFYLFYLDAETSKKKIGERYEFIAKTIPCSARAARNWIDELVEALSVLLWGVDGLKPKNLLGKNLTGIT